MFAIQPIGSLLFFEALLQLLFFFLTLDLAFNVLLRAHVHVQLILDLADFRNETFFRVQGYDRKLRNDRIDLYVFERERLVCAVLFEQLLPLLVEWLHVCWVEELHHVRVFPDVCRVRLEVLVHEEVISLKDAEKERASVAICFSNLFKHDLLHLIEFHGLKVHLKEHVLGKDADMFAENCNLIDMAVVDNQQRNADKI